MFDKKIREEELKNKVSKAIFGEYDCTKILGNIDFCVSKFTDKFEGRIEQLFAEKDLQSPFMSFLWAEAKAGTSHDIFKSIVQLILTIGKDRIYEKYIAPTFLGAFDAEKIAFIQYDKISKIFSQNDFNWKVAPSDHESREFKQLYSVVGNEIKRSSTIFNYDDNNLKKFIKLNFKLGSSGHSKLVVTKNNFTSVYFRWVKFVKPSIKIPTSWEKLAKAGIIDADFFLADLLSDKDNTIRDSLFVLLKSNYYEFGKSVSDLGFETVSKAEFADGQRAYNHFWGLYKRPPKKEYWDYIVARRDLLVPQDVRERKGSYFTPAQWVELSQEYLARELGENWQDEYYIWDCCAGTGNLLAGLVNKYNIWASTLDQADVDVMLDRVKNGANLLPGHIFKFDFLNDDLMGEKIPDGLKAIFKDKKKREKLLIYINPPYAEAASVRTISGTGNNKTNVALEHLTYSKYLDKIGIAGRELFAQFSVRIYAELKGVKLGEFCKLKFLQAPNFKKMREFYRPKLLSLFLMPANTFDNVRGEFPIGFHVWDTGIDEKFTSVKADVYDKSGEFVSNKIINNIDRKKTINDWMKTTRNRPGERVIGFMSAKGADFENQNYVYVVNDKAQLPHPRGTAVTDRNFIEICVYIAARKVVEKDWINDRDQFFAPNLLCMKDKEFVGDCIVYAIFDNCINIKSSKGKNFWIPFMESEVNSPDVYDEHFLCKLIKTKKIIHNDLLNEKDDCVKSDFEFSEVANDVLESAKCLYRYYHKVNGSNQNASYYDIREYFQGRSDNGKLNGASGDSVYNELIDKIRKCHNKLRKKIVPKIYKYQFLE